MVRSRRFCGRRVRNAELERQAISKGRVLMKRPRLLRFLFASLLILLFVGGLVVLPVVREMRQQEKNRALIEAVKQNDARAVIRLLEAGADANARDVPQETRPFWRVMWDKLREPTKKGKAFLPTALQVTFANHRRDANGSYPSDTRILRALLEHGANPNVLDQDEISPLSYALLHGPSEYALLLIQHGSKLVLPWQGKLEPQFADAAETTSDLRIFQAMLDRGADINAQEDGDGSTALMSAARYKQLDLVRFLLAHHAKVMIKDASGETALDYARLGPTWPSEAKQIIQALRQAGAH